MKRRHSLDPTSPVRNVGIPTTSTQSVTSSSTKITDLIDDCLFEIYKKLELDDLASVADVCQRLRSTSKDFFTRTEYRWLEYPSDILNYEKMIAPDFDYNELMFKTERVLRNFGAFITDFDESFNSSNVLLNRRNISEYYFNEFAIELIKLLALYCSESLTELKVECFGFRDALSEIRRPLFPNVQRLYWNQVQRQTTEDILLSIWLPNLREMEIRSNQFKHSDNIGYRFDKLTSVSIAEGYDPKSIVKFLSLNPQLRELNINGSFEFINFRILESIAKYTPDINVVRLRFVDKMRIVEYPDPSTQNYFSELKNLKCFSVTEFRCGYNRSLDIVRSIALAEVPLESLTVEDIDTPVNARLIVQEVIKLKTLVTLNLSVHLDNKRDIIRICEQLQNLTELRVGHEELVNSADILEIVNTAPKLQWLYPLNRVQIDGNIGENLRKIVRKRADNSQLILKVTQAHCITNLSNEWIKVQEDDDFLFDRPIFDRPFVLTSELTVCCHETTNPGICLLPHSEITRFTVRFKNWNLLRGSFLRNRRTHQEVNPHHQYLHHSFMQTRRTTN